MRKLKDARTERITKEMAEKHAKLDTVHVDRPLSERRLDVYRDVLKRKEFRPVNWASAYCQETRQSYRVNGRHTATLFSSVDLDKQQPLFAQIEEYICGTLKDVAELWSTYDSSLQVRNATDINRSFAMSITELRDIAAQNMKIINLAVGGLAFYQSPTSVGVLDGGRGGFADRAELLFDHVEIVQWISDTLFTDVAFDNAKPLRRVPVVAAMIGSYYKCQRDAKVFWTAVLADEGSSISPERQLYRFLRESQVITRSAHKKKVFPREFYGRSVSAWNMWRSKQTAKLTYRSAGNLPAFK